ncbi:MAG: prevent-host-death protein [Archangium sp.]|nr:prevent-host-death protein [Archangium sp.]
MKNATLPSLRVEKKFRDQLEDLLQPGESVSSFMERAVRESVSRRAEDAAFYARGIAAGEKAKKTGRYRTLDQVMATLRKVTDAAQKKAKR